ncbi:SDR family oxidoreductase [Sphingomonas ginkgonis]|uniref:SDR family oxidoreductase n=1 Tax=Sphingomonas ginkgonis TaxID=2315330 RepID=A0A3R9YMH8_9SPHN|nr:SDR family oxidoreductase [Sphingomonas ginkgonis]
MPNGNGIAGKVAIVTGAGSGIGREIASVALFLVSDAASYVHGQTIAVDGGLSSSHPTARQQGSCGLVARDRVSPASCPASRPTRAIAREWRRRRSNPCRTRRSSPQAG